MSVLAGVEGKTVTCGRKVGQFDCCSVVQGDCRELVPLLPEGCVIVSDPPYNVGYHYDTYADRKDTSEYWREIQSVMPTPCVLIHYPEDVFEFSVRSGIVPTEVVAWVYNANTPKQWRMVAWFGTKPDFSKAGQPYKNPTDKRVAALIAAGKDGRLYDWWDVQQVKNVSEEKTEHPCQMPLLVMERIVKVTDGEVIVDPFTGSGTTLVAAKKLGRHFLGFELSPDYCAITRSRLDAIDAQPSLFDTIPAQMSIVTETL